MKRFFHTVALAGLLALNVPMSHAVDSLPVAPFQARYEVFGAGFAIGEAVMTLVDAGSGKYQMSSNVRPNGLATLLVSGQIDEKASGDIRDGTVRPARYERQMKTSRKSNAVQLRFDWASGQIQARNDDEQVTLPLSPGVLDPLSLNLTVMWDLQSGRLPSQYTLADKTKLKTYQIQNQGEETLSTPLGKLRTVRVQQSTPGKTRMTTFWFAPELHYLPVRVIQEKDGKEELRMEIRAVER